MKKFILIICVLMLCSLPSYAEKQNNSFENMTFISCNVQAQLLEKYILTTEVVRELNYTRYFYIDDVGRGIYNADTNLELPAFLFTNEYIKFREDTGKKNNYKDYTINRHTGRIFMEGVASSFWYNYLWKGTGTCTKVENTNKF